MHEDNRCRVLRQMDEPPQDLVAGGGRAEDEGDVFG